MEEVISVYFTPLFDQDSNVMRDHFLRNGFTNIQRISCFPNYCRVEFSSLEEAKSFISFYDGNTIKGYKCSCSLSKSRKPMDKPPRPPRDDYPSSRRDYNDRPRESSYDNRDYRRDDDSSRYSESRDWDQSYDRRSPDYGRDSYDRRPSDHRDKYHSSSRESTKTVIVRGIDKLHTLTERDLFNEFIKVDCFIRQVEVRGPVAYISFDTYGDARIAVNKMNNANIKGCHIRVDYTEDIPLNLPRIGIPLIAVEDKRI